MKNVKYVRKAILLLLILITLTSTVMAANSVKIYFFWGEGCPHCAHEKPFLEELENKYPEVEVEMYETWQNSTNAQLFSDLAEAFGTTARGVPTTFIDDEYWVGYADYMKEEIESKVVECINTGCSDSMARLKTQSTIDESASSPAHSACVHLFTADPCTQCDELSTELNELQEEYELEFVIHEDEDELFQTFKDSYSLSQTGYPVAFIGNNYLVGYSAINQNLEELIEECVTTGCPCPAHKVEGITSQMPSSGDITPENQTIINLPLVGEVDITNMSLYLVTALISFIDGFNPCSLWLITFLIGIVLYTGSRKKTILIGLTFLITITLVYGLFMTGLVNVFYYINHLLWIRLLIGIIALIFAAINIKDYFWYKKGISLTISDEAKPGIYKRVRDIMSPEKSLIGMMTATIVLALSVTLVELPCTAGLPMLWTNIIATNNIKGLEFAAHLGLYLLMMMIDESIVLFSAVWTLKVSKLEEKHGRILKLFGGLVMLFLGGAMIFAPELMDDIKSTLIFFITAIIITWIVNHFYNKYKNKEISKKNKDGDKK